MLEILLPSSQDQDDSIGDLGGIKNK